MRRGLGIGYMKGCMKGCMKGYMKVGNQYGYIAYKGNAEPGERLGAGEGKGGEGSVTSSWMLCVCMHSAPVEKHTHLVWMYN